MMVDRRPSRDFNLRAHMTYLMPELEVGKRPHCVTHSGHHDATTLVKDGLIFASPEDASRAHAAP